MSRIQHLYNLHDDFNRSEFSGKLNTIRLLMKRNDCKDGWYQYETQRDATDAPGKGSGWHPRVDTLDRAYIVISDGCWEEDSVEGTLLHEMIHQYQCEILDRPPTHDAIFCSIARRLEREYGVPVR